MRRERRRRRGLRGTPGGGRRGRRDKSSVAIWTRIHRLFRIRVGIKKYMDSLGDFLAHLAAPPTLCMICAYVCYPYIMCTMTRRRRECIEKKRRERNGRVRERGGEATVGRGEMEIRG